MEVSGGKRVAAGDVGESNQGVYEGELARVVELEPRYAAATGEVGRLGELLKLAPVDKGFENVLLDVETAVGAAICWRSGRSCAMALGSPKSVTVLVTASVRSRRWSRTYCLMEPSRS